MLFLQVWRNKPYGGLLGFFILPVAMIGFPGIKSIQFEKGVFTLDKDAHELQQNPTNTALREKIAQQVAEINARPSNDPDTKTKVAQAQFELGDHAAAAAAVDEVLKVQPKLPAALQLKKRIETDQQLSDLSKTVAENPTDTAAKQQLEAVTHEAAKQPVASPEMLANIAAGEAAIGHTDEAAAFNKKALQINPNLQRAKILQDRIAGVNR
jgi:tetratricopeptide (TPR) repeat protein